MAILLPDTIDCFKFSPGLPLLSGIVFFYLLERADTFLAMSDDTTLLEVDGSLLCSRVWGHSPYESLHSDPSPSLNQESYLTRNQKELLKVCKSCRILSIYEPPEVDLWSLPPHSCRHKRRVLNPKIHDVIKKEVEKLLDAGLIYLISDSPWDGRVCIDYRKLNEATRKDHFPLPFMDQMLERLAGNEYYCFLDGFSGYFQIPIDPNDQEKTTFTCPYGTFAYRRHALVYAVHGHVSRLIDSKGAEIAGRSTSSRRENPYENVFDPKEINETFPLETLNSVTSHDNQSTSWFADIANYHAGNFLIKGMAYSTYEEDFSKDVRHYFLG
ncbi:hypothetical protein Tco_1312761 [Tanacetum coccineum]